MEKYYWNIETDKVESIDDIILSYALFAKEYETFDYYLSACQTYNNGALVTLAHHIKQTEDNLSRYSDSYDDSEREAVRQDIARMKQLYLET